jgi:hypothetical protein
MMRCWFNAETTEADAMLLDIIMSAAMKFAVQVLVPSTTGRKFGGRIWPDGYLLPRTG